MQFSGVSRRLYAAAKRIFKKPHGQCLGISQQWLRALLNMAKREASRALVWRFLDSQARVVRVRSGIAGPDRGLYIHVLLLIFSTTRYAGATVRRCVFGLDSNA